MSRIVVFDNNGMSLGEIQANCSRGWAINEGGESKIKVSADAALASWLDFGRMVMIEHPRLPAWAGMIDTPWGSMPPIEVSIYQAPYLLALRTPDEPLKFSGTAGEIALQLVNAANAQDDLLIRAGDIDFDDPDRVENFNQSPIWEHLVGLAKRANMEIQIRPERDMNNKLVLFLDMKRQLGCETGLLLRDGINANMIVSKAEISSQIWNRITGIGDQSSQQSRMQSAAMIDADSINRWRLRSRVVQFQGVTAQSTLDVNTSSSLAQSGQPFVQLQVKVLDQGDTFDYLRLGNWLEVHASAICLPGGRRGWRGKARITAMTYKEETNQVEMLLEGEL